MSPFKKGVVGRISRSVSAIIQLISSRALSVTSSIGFALCELVHLVIEALCVMV